jgi:hypothetical protein
MNQYKDRRRARRLHSFMLAQERASFLAGLLAAITAILLFCFDGFKGH